MGGTQEKVGEIASLHPTVRVVADHDQRRSRGRRGDRSHPMMISHAREIDWDGVCVAVPSFLTLMMIPMTFSIITSCCDLLTWRGLDADKCAGYPERTRPLMRRNIWKAAAISLATYATVIVLGFAGDFRLTLFLIAALQVTWTLYCSIQLVQLRIRGGNKRDAQSYDRESYGFALGGSISSVVLLAAVVVLTQVV